ARGPGFRTGLAAPRVHAGRRHPRGSRRRHQHGPVLHALRLPLLRARPARALMALLPFALAVRLLALPLVEPMGRPVPPLRMHLFVSEELDPDRLLPLARPGVVLWVRTKSNT